MIDSCPSGQRKVMFFRKSPTISVGIGIRKYDSKRTNPWPKPSMRPLILICFFLSGASGLIFELLWTRMLTLVFGSTTLAVSTVLATFMGGLGLGSYLAGRFADRLRRPVLFYAGAECIIGLYALLVPWAISHYEPLNHWLWATFGDSYSLLSIFRFAASALLLLLPTTLMGATLPILARHFVSRPSELQRVGGNLGRLYAVNVLGACGGSFLAGFIFLPDFGISTTNRIAATFNFTLAVAAWIAHRWSMRQPVAADLDEMLSQAVALGEIQASSVVPAPPAITRRARNVVLFGFALSGATAMTLQVLWTRALAVVIGSSVYSFTLILLAFLVGLGGGAAVLGARADRTANPVRWLGITHLGIAFAVGFSYLIIDDLPYVFTWLLSATDFGVSAILFCQFILACVAILPATLLMGAIFPLTMRIAMGTLDNVGRDVGSTYALNTLGAITGSFAAGFVILPSLGLQRGIYVSVVAGLALAAALFVIDPKPSRRSRAIGVGCAVGLALVGLLLPRWNLTSFSIGFFRASIAKDFVQRRQAGKEWKSPILEFYEDGIATTVSVDRWGKTYSMKNNGKVDASSDADMPTQVSVGMIPLFLYPGDKPPRSALIGFGSGVTTGAMTQGPIGTLEVVELEPAIYRASHFFDHVNHRPLENRRVTARVGDGRNFLSQRSDRFDVIVSQPSNPWITGVSNLFTREYFRAIAARLEPDGLFCQWAQLYEMAPWNVKTIYRTLAAEFPYVAVFSAEDLSSDTVLIASMKPIVLDLEKIGRRMKDPIAKAEALRAGWHTPHDIVARLLVAPDEIAAFTAGAPINTDDNALIEFAAPRDLMGAARNDRYLARVYGPQWPYARLLGLARNIDAGDEPGTGAGKLARSLLAFGRTREATFWIRKALQAPTNRSTEHARHLLSLVATRLSDDPEIPLAPEGDLMPPAWPEAIKGEAAQSLDQQFREVQALMKAKRYIGAYKVMEDWPAALWDKPSNDFALLAGFLHYKAEFYEDAIGLLKPLSDDLAYLARRPEALYYLGRARFAYAHHGKAIEAFEQFIALQSKLGRIVEPEAPGMDLGLPPPPLGAATHPRP